LLAVNHTVEDIKIHDPVAYAIDVIMDSDHVSKDSDHVSSTGQVRHSQTVDLQGVTIRNVEGVLGPVPQAVCGKGRVCPRAVGRFYCTPEFPCHNMRLEHIHVSGFKPSPHYLEPCGFANFSGSSVDVMPTGCAPPQSLKTSKTDDEGRTLMFWLIDSNNATAPPTKKDPRPKPVPDSDAVWERRIANVKAHRANVTGVSPCLYSFGKGGEFAQQAVS